MPVTATAPARRSRLADVIHDDILQMLGVCLLEAELCRRFWRNGQEEQAVAELNEVLRGLEAVTEASRRIAGELRVADARVRGTRPQDGRPRLSVVGADDEPAASVRAEEIVQTLGVCLLQAELCRRLYQAGHEQPALKELNTLLQRLESIADAFRRVMETLRRVERLARTA